LPKRFSEATTTAGAFLLLLRPAHWMKNGFVLLPLLFSLGRLEAGAVERSLYACAAFCMASSAVYALNDILDRERDRRCALKRRRPVASGALTPLQAAIASAACAVGALFIAVFLLPPASAVILGGYALLNVAYCMSLKRLVILDVIALSAGFVLRVAAGGAAIPVRVSAWMILTTFFLSLFLGFGKRRAELAATRRGSARDVLGQYSMPFLMILIPLCAGLTIIMYALSVIQPSIALRADADTLLYTVPLVVYGLLRYLHMSLRDGRGADAAEIVLKDAALLVTVLLWGGLVILMAVIRV
jgi:decaprenyl-phosphate phosphoribosyltransferase